ncbi:MAG: hypothetical protein KDA91_23425 [Planctomycetaceae bacterium]|nr:hypothetical protein [Planctomycetaceae bacterium]
MKSTRLRMFALLILGIVMFASVVFNFRSDGRHAQELFLAFKRAASETGELEATQHLKEFLALPAESVAFVLVTEIRKNAGATWSESYSPTAMDLLREVPAAPVIKCVDDALSQPPVDGFFTPEEQVCLLYLARATVSCDRSDLALANQHIMNLLRKNIRKFLRSDCCRLARSLNVDIGCVYGE